MATSRVNKYHLGFLIFIILGVIVAIALTQKNKMRLTFVSPKRGEVVEAIYGLGKVKTHRKYEIKLGIATTVKVVHVKEGQHVEKGDALIQFTDSNQFKAPFSGTITRVDFQPPEAVMPQVPVLSLEDLSDKYIEVSLEQKDILRVKMGQTALVLFESLRGNKYQGMVETLFPKNEEFLVHIKVQGLPANILPGMTADVSIEVARISDALLIPIAGLESGMVLVKRPNGKEEKVPVRIGSIDGQWAQLLEGDISEQDLLLSKQ